MLVYEALRDNSHTLSLGFIHKAPLEFHPSATTFGSGFLNYFFILICLLYTKADYWLGILDIVFWFGMDVYFTCLTFSIQNLLHIYIYGSPISHYRCVFLLYLIIFVYFATKKKKTWYAMPWFSCYLIFHRLFYPRYPCFGVCKSQILLTLDVFYHSLYVIRWLGLDNHYWELCKLCLRLLGGLCNYDLSQNC